MLLAIKQYGKIVYLKLYATHSPVQTRLQVRPGGGMPAPGRV